MAKEAKKEAFRKYLESSGVIDALTKVLVALYEENDKPQSVIEFIQHSLGAPTISEYEKLLAEKAELQLKYEELLTLHQETCKESVWYAQDPRARANRGYGELKGSNLGKGFGPLLIG